MKTFRAPGNGSAGKNQSNLTHTHTLKINTKEGNKLLISCCGQISRVSGSPRRTANPPESNNAFRKAQGPGWQKRGEKDRSWATYHPQRGTDEPNRRGYERPRKKKSHHPAQHTLSLLCPGLRSQSHHPHAAGALMLVLRSSASDTTGIEQGNHHPGRVPNESR